MLGLPEALVPLAAYRQFFLYKLVPSQTRPGRTEKIPLDISGQVCDAHDPSKWMSADEAIALAAYYGDGHGVAFTFTENDPFYFFDIDDCLLDDGVTWSPVAMDLLGRFEGAAVEVSQSGKGLHIIGCGVPSTPTAARRRKAKDPVTGESDGLFDLYTERRFVALTGTNAIGSAGHIANQQQLDYVVAYWFRKTATETVEWTMEPVEGWEGITDDAQLIAKALESKSAGSAFGGRCSFRDLWERNDDKLSEAFPDNFGNRAYDESSADASLAQHLAFWTGNNCERILDLMRQSALAREKWQRDDYLRRTILQAVSMQSTVYAMQTVDNTIAEENGACKLRGSEAQQRFAENVRAQKLIDCGGNQEMIDRFCKVATSRFWIDNKDKTASDIFTMLTPIERASDPHGDVDKGVEYLSGYQYLDASRQEEFFKGCVYIQEAHKILTPDGDLLRSEQFNAVYGGYSFQLDDTGEKTTRKAWDAFTESQVLRYPKAHSTCFRPDLPTSALVREDKRILANTYHPIDTPRKVGDVLPFLTHLQKILPNDRDQQILLSFMAAGVQYKGVKFQWAPLLQGCEGNGKTLFTRCMAFCVGRKYVHMPPAHNLVEKYNDWLFDKLFIGIEDIYVPEHKLEIIEILKPMITGDDMAMRAMQQGQVMREVTANFMLNSNHKSAVRKTRKDRRFCVFYTAQQDPRDIERDGMGGDYFPKLYNWLKGEGDYSNHGLNHGYSIVNNFLTEFKIPTEFNPATFAAHRAPVTSSTEEVIRQSLGAVEQELLEAIEENRPGFAGGWVSSVALDKLLYNLRANRSIPPNKRREILNELGYDWHPNLHDGRSSTAIPLDDNKKPRLFIKDGHIAINLKTPAEIVKSYVEAQNSVGSTGLVESKFSQTS